MADPNTRQGKRTPVTLKIKFKSETLEQFIERYAVDVSQGGIFIRTKEPLAVGTQMKFEFQLRDASPLIAGEGTVVWTRENDPSRPAIAPGMGVRFDRLGEGSQTVLEKILAEKAKQAPQRGGGNEAGTKPPLFTDTPTKVAPAPVQDALLGNRSGRTRQDSQETPLPKPMPFHSDADEFGAEAFEEATKVRALDELVAQTAAGDGGMSVDELAARRGRAETPLAEPPIDDRLKTVPDRDSAPGLPSPPESGISGRTGKLLDTSPSPRSASPSSGPPLRPSQPNLPAASELSAKTRLGLEPAKAQTTPPYQPPPDRDRVPRAVAAEQSHPSAPKRPSAAPIVIGILFVVAAAMAAVWYFVLREKVEEAGGTKPVGSGSALATGSNGSATPTNGSGGSAVAMNGSAGSGSAGSAGVQLPKGPTVDTVIAANVAKSTVTIVDGDEQTGPAPFTAKLEKDKVYKVRVEAPGYVKVELDVKGGQDKVTAKLALKPHVLSVSSDPPGAAILVDGTPTGKVTPFDVELTAAQAAKPKVRVTLRKSGFRQVDQMVDAGSFTDQDVKMTHDITAKLAVQVIYTPPPNNHNNGSGSGSGSATPTNGGSGAGSATPDHNTGSGATPPDPAGTGSASTGGGGGGTTPAPGASLGGGAKTGSGGDPEPDFTKNK